MTREQALALAAARKRMAEQGAAPAAPVASTPVSNGLPEWMNAKPEMAMAADQAVKAGQEFDANVGTWLNRAGESMTLGVVGDEASAALTGILPGRTYGGELERYRANEEGMSTGGKISADVLGALVPGVGAAGLIGRAGSTAGRIGIGAGLGAAAGGIQGFAEGEGGAADRVANAGIGAGIGGVLGGAIPAIGAGVRGVAAGRAEGQAILNAARGAPTSEALRAEGNALYRQIDDAGVQIKPESFGTARQEILDYLRTNTGFDELPGAGSLTPNASRVMGIMDEAGQRMAAEPTAALPFKALDQMRRQAGAAAGNVTNKTDQGAGMAIIRQLDDYVQRLGPDDVAGGDVSTLQSAIGKAREVWSRMSKSQTIDDAIEKSDNYLSGAASGVRNQFKNILQNKKLSAQFTEAEKAALRRVTHGNALTQMINLAGGGLAQVGSVGGGLAMGGPMGGLAGAGLAVGQRKLSEAVTMRAAEQARAAIASGALRNPDVLKALEGAGQRPEMISNSVLNALMATSRQ